VAQDLGGQTEIEIKKAVLEQLIDLPEQEPNSEFGNPDKPIET
jgi:hypothetical protein